MVKIRQTRTRGCDVAWLVGVSLFESHMVRVRRVLSLLTVYYCQWYTTEPTVLFIGYYWLSLATMTLIGYYWLSLVIHWLLLAIISYYWLLLATIGYHWLLLAINSSYWLLLAIISSHWLLLGIISSHCQEWGLLQMILTT